jgi:hypothetical protein
MEQPEGISRIVGKVGRTKLPMNYGADTDAFLNLLNASGLQSIPFGGPEGSEENLSNDDYDAASGFWDGRAIQSLACNIIDSGSVAALNPNDQFITMVNDFANRLRKFGPEYWVLCVDQLDEEPLKARVARCLLGDADYFIPRPELRPASHC